MVLVWLVEILSIVYLKLNFLKNCLILVLFSLKEDIFLLQQTTTKTPPTTTTTSTKKILSTLTNKPTKTLPPTTTKTTTTTTTTTTKTKKTTPLTSTLSTRPNTINPALIKPCTSPIDAVFYSPENNIHVLIEKKFLWEYNVKQHKWSELNFFQTYPGVHEGVRGGFRCKNNYTWFFKSKFVVFLFYKSRCFFQEFVIFQIK
jgi:hypothetical protein